MQEDSPMGAGHSDTLTDMAPADPTSTFAPFRGERPISKFVPLHRVQWPSRLCAKRSKMILPTRSTSSRNRGSDIASVTPPTRAECLPLLPTKLRMASDLIIPPNVGRLIRDRRDALCSELNFH